MEKKAQVTIFIIIAILIVAVILIFFLWIKPTYLDNQTSNLNFESCVGNVVENAVGELELKAGLIHPGFTYMYNGENFTYLCYTNEFYKTCSVQVPFITKNFERQIEVLIRDDIDNCYSNSIENLIADGYDVVSGYVDYNVEIEPGVVRIQIDAPTVVGGSVFTKFNVGMSSPVYEMTMMASSLLQFEAQYGDADVDSTMLLYPDYIISKIKRSDETTIYIIEHKYLKNKFQFASRSLAWPAGYAS